MAAIGSVAAIVVVKQLFGGIGQILQIRSCRQNYSSCIFLCDVIYRPRMADVDAVTTATFAGTCKWWRMPLFEMFIGQRAGHWKHVSLSYYRCCILVLRGVIK